MMHSIPGLKISEGAAEPEQDARICVGDEEAAQGKL